MPLDQFVRVPWIQDVGKEVWAVGGLRLPDVFSQEGRDDPDPSIGDRRKR